MTTPITTATSKASKQNAIVIATSGSIVCSIRAALMSLAHGLNVALARADVGRATTPFRASAPGRLLALVGLRLDQPTLDRVPRELYAVAHAEFLEDVLAVAVDGLDADEERIGDLLRRVRLGDELQHF
jgi:hypothetical protein